MTDFLADSAVVAVLWCPTCQPSRDPLAEVLDLRYCEPHTPPRGGTEDDRVGPFAYLSSGAEAGGDDNRRWCELLHGRPACAPGS